MVCWLQINTRQECSATSFTFCAGAFLDPENNVGLTPLFEATRLGYINIVQMLLSCGKLLYLCLWLIQEESLAFKLEIYICVCEGPRFIMGNFLSCV